MCLSIGFTAREGCPFPKEIEGWKVMRRSYGGTWQSRVYSRTIYHARETYYSTRETYYSKSVGLEEYFSTEYFSNPPVTYEPGFHVYLQKPFLSSFAEPDAVVVRVRLQEILAIGQDGNTPCAVGRWMTILRED